MFGGMFYFLLSMSIVATITGVIVLLIRKMKRIPRRIILWLWIIPFIRMIIPFGVSGKYSLMSLISKYATKTVHIQDIGGYNAFNNSNIFDVSVMNCIELADSYNPMVYKVNILERVFDVASIVWIVVALALCITFIFMYGITLNELRGSVHLRENIYVSDIVVSPAVYGIIRPKIIIPGSYKDRNLEYVLMHENAHIKRGDNFWRVIAFFVASVHWFNPLIWILLKCFLEDLELACDEKVLTQCGEEQKKLYAMSLLECAESKSVFASAFGGAAIRIRIENVLSYKRLSIVSLICFTIFVIAIMYMLLTNAA